MASIPLSPCVRPFAQRVCVGRERNTVHFNDAIGIAEEVPVEHLTRLRRASQAGGAHRQRSQVSTRPHASSIPYQGTICGIDAGRRFQWESPSRMTRPIPDPANGAPYGAPDPHRNPQGDATKMLKVTTAEAHGPSGKKKA